ncbi:MAG TPA: hypothetical protein VK279_08010 [Solirubrobacteraceae bacterium]|nr:hypothetical protein [Solirubrobacteraceae bacterium]
MPVRALLIAVISGSLVAVAALPAAGRVAGAAKVRTYRLDMRFSVRHRNLGDDISRGTGREKRLGAAIVKYERVGGRARDQKHSWRFRAGTVKATAVVENLGGTEPSAQRLSGEGRITGGTGAYRGAKGTAKITGTFDEAAATPSSEYHWVGTIRYDTP